MLKSHEVFNNEVGSLIDKSLKIVVEEYSLFPKWTYRVNFPKLNIEACLYKHKRKIKKYNKLNFNYTSFETNKKNKTFKRKCN